jgi:hypothetical protein
MLDAGTDTCAIPKNKVARIVSQERVCLTDLFMLIILLDGYELSNFIFDPLFKTN